MWCWERELPILETKITASKPVDNVYQYHSDSFGNHIRTVNENWRYFFIVWKTIPNTEYLLGIKRNQWEAFNSDEKRRIEDMLWFEVLQIIWSIQCIWTID